MSDPRCVLCGGVAEVVPVEERRRLVCRACAVAFHVQLDEVHWWPDLLPEDVETGPGGRLYLTNARNNHGPTLTPGRHLRPRQSKPRPAQPHPSPDPPEDTHAHSGQ